MSANRSSAIWGIIASIVFVTVVVGVLLLFDIDDQVLRLLAWLDAQGAWASLLFILIMALVVVLLLPGVLFTTGAGFVFGVVEGTLYVVVGTTLGAVIAFLIARYLFGERAARFVRQHARLKLVSEELTPQGWKIVMLTRLIPLFPFKLSNYFFGLTAFSLRGFSVGTFLGVIPLSLNNVYLGSIAADVAMLGTRNTGRTPLEWGLYSAGFLVAVGVVVYLGRLASRTLAKYTDEEDTKGE
ncbi:putative membrane protein YdjX (TVP38/TMEM64 family) [Thiogranum longum]|uniref:TVP38/TMEM64 family membrane protein n=1 Tax=Thiogranum longum TaxID=1537524 RepID=A0A4R1HB94_9GAMM|nr:TVP38/TMEM64 family protein [Thiogranum longum]TCK18648.1 putative membrane protein YdjX (TVP38/TMEM64 family) [Thiogranum longum]